MDTVIQAALIGLLQGLTEFIPISSSAHLELAPWIAGWESDGLIGSLAFDVFLHLGTLVALLVYFFRDWLRYLGAWVASVRERRIGDDPDRRIAWLLVLATIPAALIGFALEGFIEDTFHGDNDGARLAIAGLPRRRRHRALPRRPARQPAPRARRPPRADRAHHRPQPGARPAARHQPLRRDDHRRPRPRPHPRGRRALQLPARHADHVRRRPLRLAAAVRGVADLERVARDRRRLRRRGALRASPPSGSSSPGCGADRWRSSAPTGSRSRPSSWCSWSSAAERGDL